MKHMEFTALIYMASVSQFATVTMELIVYKMYTKYGMNKTNIWSNTTVASIYKNYIICRCMILVKKLSNMILYLRHNACISVTNFVSKQLWILNISLEFIFQKVTTNKDWSTIFHEQLMLQIIIHNDLLYECFFNV